VRLQLIAATAAALAWAAPRPAAAEDRFDFTTTWYQEKRRGSEGLTVIHPQLDLELDAGETMTIGLGYAADAVTGATATVYSTDAVSSATEFDDLRHQGSLSLGFGGSRSRLTAGAAVAAERDYLSIAVSGSASVDLPGKNTNLALSYTHNFDEVCDRDNSAAASSLERRALTGVDPCEKKRGIFGEDTPAMTVWQDLAIDTLQATLTQNLSPTLIGQISVYGQILDGFQANPYRRVRVSGAEPQESVPDVRARAALTVRVNKYLRGLGGAVHASARGYSDTWGVNAGTGELGYSQYAGSSLLMRFRARVHQQTEAKFFKDAFFYEVEGPAQAFFTGDRELAPVRNVLAGARLSYIASGEGGEPVLALFDEIQVNLKGELLFLDELPANPLEENRDGIERQFLSSGQLLDAFIIQLGILARY
jgi:hypothetical protein